MCGICFILWVSPSFRIPFCFTICPDEPKHRRKGLAAGADRGAAAPRKTTLWSPRKPLLETDVTGQHQKSDKPPPKNTPTGCVYRERQLPYRAFYAFLLIFGHILGHCLLCPSPLRFQCVLLVAASASFPLSVSLFSQLPSLSRSLRPLHRQREGKSSRGSRPYEGL